MALRDNTKKLFADTLLKMASEMPLEKVRIKDLCERCGADRQTFYYHFHDKYDLIAWIFIQDYSEVIELSGGGYPIEHAIKILERMYKNRKFYRQAYSDKSQNAVSEYVYDYFVKLGLDVIRAHLGVEDPGPLITYIIKSHAFASVGHTIEWLNGKASYTTEEFAQYMYITMPEILRDAYGITL